MLEVVEEQQHLLAVQEARQAVSRAERLRDLGLDQLGVRHGGERHPEDSVTERAHELGCDLEREACLPGSARAGDCDLPRAVGEEREHLGKLALTSDERAGRERQVRCVERLERGEPSSSELKESFGLSEILEAVLAEVDQFDGVGEECPCLRRDDDLPTVSARRDARGVMDVDAHVSLIGYERLTGVEPDPYAHRRCCKRGLPVQGRRRRVAGRTEHEEERVSLGVDLDPAVERERVAKETPVLGEEPAYPDPCVRRRLVEPSTSVNTSVRVPVGRLRTIATLRRSGSCRRSWRASLPASVEPV